MTKRVIVYTKRSDRKRRRY